MPRHRRSAWPPKLSDDSLPFVVKCSDGHGRKGPKPLHRGILTTAPDVPPVVEWVEHGASPVPPLGEPGDDGDRKVTLRCNVCGLDRQMKESLLVRALRGLADAGLKDGGGRVTLDIAYVPR